jgi:hypothetical protein
MRMRCQFKNVSVFFPYLCYYCFFFFFFFFLKGACIFINQETKVSPSTQFQKYMKDTNTSKFDLNSV